MLEVSFAVDKYTEECAYVAIHSMLKHASEPVSVLVLYENEEEMPGQHWERQLLAEGFRFDLRHQQVNVDAFRHCKALFNSHTNYLRIYAPRYATSERILYSDVDVVFTDDVVQIARMELGRACIARNGGSPCTTRGDAEKALLYEFGKTPEDVYYGSGLALINVKTYRSTEVISRCEAIAQSHAFALKYHEQTLWNCVFSGPESKGIPEKWCQSPPLRKQDAFPPLVPGIVHFAGSPKPWDLLGELSHPAYKIWEGAAREAGLRLTKFKKYFRKSDWQRAIRIRGQYGQWFPYLAR